MRTESKPVESGEEDEVAEPQGVSRTRWGLVAVLALGTLAIASEMTLAAFALPLIGADFGVSSAATAWVLLAYTLPLAALAMPAGRWLDRADPGLVMVLAMLGVGVTGVMGALAPNFEFLIVARILHGLTAAVFLATSMPFITSNVRPDQRGRAMSFIMALMSVGSIVATPLGGLVADAFGWREVFLVKMPLVLVILAFGYRLVQGYQGQGPRLPAPRRTLLVDVLLFGSAITILMFALEQVEGRWVLAAVLLPVGVALLAWWSRLPGTRPVLTLLRRPGSGLPLLALLTVSSSIGLVGFLLPFFVSEVMGASPNVLGGAMAFFMAVMAVVTPITGFVVDRYGPSVVAVIGAVISVVGGLSHLTLGADSSLMDLAWRMVLFGIGFGLFNPAVMTAIMTDSPIGQNGSSGGLANTGRTLGSVIGPAVAALGWSLGDGGLDGFRTGTALVAALMVVGLIGLLVSNRRQTPASQRESQLQRQ